VARLRKATQLTRIPPTLTIDDGRVAEQRPHGGSYREWLSGQVQRVQPSARA
jgi:hypothetical protein